MTTQYRAEFDATVTFSNGGSLSANGFRVDVASAEVDAVEVGQLFVRSLNLLMTDTVEVRQLRVFAEAHKGTAGAPSNTTGADEVAADRRLVELNHVVTDGMITYPGLPGPEFGVHISREQSRASYAPGTEFQIDRITMVGNTGTYLDSPRHRYADGTDLAGLPLEAVADLPCVVVRTAGSGARAVDVSTLLPLDVRGRAVLLHTGGDEHFGTDRYAADAPYLTRGGAQWLVDRGAALVGIDAVNIDDTADIERPAHSILLAAGVPVVEHLTGLEQLPPHGARFTAVPLRLSGVGTVSVRAFASVPGGAP